MVTQTNWTVITGAPSSGKTSVFTLLEEAGIPTRPEAATICIETRLKLGETIDQICNVHAQTQLQDEILAKGIEIQHATNPADPYFFDRSPIDTLAYCKLYGMDEKKFMEAAAPYRYKQVFQLDPLPFTGNHVRIEDDAIAAQLHAHITEAYEQLDYEIIRVPVLSIRERAAYILRAMR